MTVKHQWSSTHSIQGQLLRQSERREVAIFLRDGALWIADFVDGDGQLIDAATWFRFNCGALSSSHARRRMLHESAIPLSADLVQRIEGLRRPPQGHEGGPIARLINAIVTRRPRGHLATILRKCLRAKPSDRIGPAA